MEADFRYYHDEDTDLQMRKPKSLIDEFLRDLNLSIYLDLFPLSEKRGTTTFLKMSRKRVD
jgi:hypothetical protein